MNSNAIERQKNELKRKFCESSNEQEKTEIQRQYKKMSNGEELTEAMCLKEKLTFIENPFLRKEVERTIATQLLNQPQISPITSNKSKSVLWGEQKQSTPYGPLDASLLLLMENAGLNEYLQNLIKRRRPNFKNIKKIDISKMNEEDLQSIQKIKEKILSLTNIISEIEDRMKNLKDADSLTPREDIKNEIQTLTTKKEKTVNKIDEIEENIIKICSNIFITKRTLEKGFSI